MRGRKPPVVVGILMYHRVNGQETRWQVMTSATSGKGRDKQEAGPRHYCGFAYIQISVVKVLRLAVVALHVAVAAVRAARIVVVFWRCQRR